MTLESDPASGGPGSSAPSRHHSASRSSAFPVLVLLLLALALVFGGCRSVKFFEKQNMAKAVMTFDRDAISGAFEGKVFSVHEAAGGGYGDAAGGGCACGG